MLPQKILIVGGGVIGEAGEVGAVGGYDVDLRVAVTLGDEGDPVTVRRPRRG